MLNLVRPLQVYETVLETALTEQGCGARSLALTGPWRWLLREVGNRFKNRFQTSELRPVQ